jgi:hypothetical protein
MAENAQDMPSMPIVEETPTSPGNPTIFQVIENKFTSMVTTARNIHLEYFIAGVFFATHSPIAGWGFLSFVFLIPAITMVQHSEWLQKLRNQPVEHIVMLAVFLISFTSYAIYCLCRAFGFQQ